jgi:cell division septation protein DedD
MTRSERGTDDRYVEFQLDGKQILIVLAGILILCSISFYFGRRVGRAEGARAGDPLAPARSAAGNEPLAVEDAGADLTFFDTVGERPKAAAPPPVLSGTAEAATRPPRSEPTPAKETAAPQVAAPAVAAPVVVPPSTPASAPTPAGRIEIQVAVLSDRASADELAGRLRAKGYRPEVTSMRADGRTRYRVRVGGYADLAAAEAAAARLQREESLKTWIPPQGG